MENHIATLQDVPLFRLLDQNERAVLARHMDVLQVVEGEFIFKAGDPGASLYVVHDGEVELSAFNHVGQKMILRVAKHGDIFGELSLLEKTASHSATAQALTSVTLLVMDYNAFRTFIHQQPDAALDLMAVMGQRLRESTETLRRTVIHNPNQLIEKRATRLQKFADDMMALSGSFPFLILHVIFFTAWIVWNVWPGIDHFDPLPFGFLTMAVSLEAIILSVIVLLSQNRQAAHDRIRADLEYDINLSAEQAVNYLHEKVDRLQNDLWARLDQIDENLAPRDEPAKHQDSALS